MFIGTRCIIGILTWQGPHVRRTNSGVVMVHVFPNDGRVMDFKTVMTELMKIQNFVLLVPSISYARMADVRTWRTRVMEGITAEITAMKLKFVTFVSIRPH